MSESGIAVFDTAIGACGIAWRSARLAGVQLPEEEGRTLARLRRRFPDLEPAEPPAWVGRAVAAIRAHLAGQSADLGAIPLDLGSVAPFDAAVYRAAQAIPPGSTRTYGELAAGLGDPAASRAVGRALGRNPWPIVVPCHRILAADGRTGGFSAPGGTATKLRLLDIEGALAVGKLPLFGAAG